MNICQWAPDSDSSIAAGGEEEAISNVNPPAVAVAVGSASSEWQRQGAVKAAAQLKRRECGIEGGRASASVSVCPLEFQEE